MEILHQPERVIIEYNGMWLVSKFEEMEKPEGWGVEQHITCVDASTFQVYMANMKSLFMDMVRNADMVIFNRCQENDPLSRWMSCCVFDVNTHYGIFAAHTLWSKADCIDSVLKSPAPICT